MAAAAGRALRRARAGGRAPRLLAFAVAAIAAGCSARPSSEPPDAAPPTATAAAAGPEPADPIAALRPFEQEARQRLDFARPPSAETGLGADPWSIRRVPGGWVGVLRGRAALVLLDDELHEIARAAAPRSPTGLALAANGDVLVAGELSPHLARFAIRDRALVPLGEARVPGVFGLRDVAVSPGGAIWVLDERGTRLLRLTLPTSGAPRGTASVASSLAVGHGAAQVLATSRHVIVNAVTEHQLVVVPTDGAGAPTSRAPTKITHDGPMWGFDARETERGLVLVAGGVEDHPLDRRSGFFGWIDSFVYAYLVEDADPVGHPLPQRPPLRPLAPDAVVLRLGTLNTSEHGIITPKALVIEDATAAHLGVLVTAYGSAVGARVGFDLARDGAATVDALALVPGVRALDRAATSERQPQPAATSERQPQPAASESVAMADPLLDAWVLSDRRGLRVVPVEREGSRPAASRLGEALFFTSLMAPKNASAGPLSRFTCETCHFEGTIDGRTHHTGRADVHATTKPLVGLVGNRPHFSRALDPDLSTVAHAEFRVAGAGNDVDPFFAIAPPDYPWLAHLGVVERQEALDLRRALMRFLIDFSHRPNAATVGRTALIPREREGAALFRDRCEGCHAARLSADDPATRIPFERWEGMVLTEAAPIVWGSAGYQRTGVLPYMHDEGTRTPSLRRLGRKYPYFTNGSARGLEELLAGVRFEGSATYHANAPPSAVALDDASRRALAAFLELL